MKIRQKIGNQIADSFDFEVYAAILYAISSAPRSETRVLTEGWRDAAVHDELDPLVESVVRSTQIRTTRIVGLIPKKPQPSITNNLKRKTMSKRRNTLFDVTFAIEHDEENPEDVVVGCILQGMRNRLEYLASLPDDEALEAFGICDSYEIEEDADE